MQRVIESLEFVLDQKECSLENAKNQLMNFGKEKASIESKLTALRGTYASTNVVINSLLNSGKSEADALVSMHRISRKALHDELNVIIEAQASINQVITEIGDLVCDLELDIYAIKEFLVNNRQIEKGKDRKLVNR